MKIIYTGWPTLKLVPDLAIDDDPNSQSFGWLFAKHPNGNWVTISNVTQEVKSLAAPEQP